MTEPRAVYEQLLRQRLTEIAAVEKRSRSLGYTRLGVVAVAVAIVWVTLASGRGTVVWVLVPLAIFAVLLILGDRLRELLEKQRRAARYFEKAIARLEGKWAGTGESDRRMADPGHPYAEDLDVFGPGGLFELLSTARTHIGEETLANWLLFPAEPGIVCSRQQAVNELRPRLDLREDLAVVAEMARTGVDPVSLARWGEEPGMLASGGIRLILWTLTALGAAGFVALWIWLLRNAGIVALTDTQAMLTRDGFLLAVILNSLFLYRRRNEVARVVASVEEAAHELQLLSDVLVRMEREQFRSPLLAALRSSLDVEGDPPSRRLAKLRRIVEYVDSRDNVFVRVLEVFILWTPHQAVRVEDWRRRSGPAVRRWLDALGQMEALCSFSTHAFEHPADPFPEFVEGGPLLQAEGIAHPLLPEGRAVRNDVSLGDPARLLIVSGSNMSGKSTLLRTLGVNAVLAQAGAPVRALRMTLSPLKVGASIRVSDSLQGGISRFYAEILRLRQILDLAAGPFPVLFLVDEVLHGTNSHDRRIGAEALVRGLVQRGAAGLITTHDLALADIAESFGDRAANVHFEDHIENGEIRFDYVMRPGVVRKSNAIELMRSVGLEI